MSGLYWVLVVLFWGAAAAVVWTYAGYPLFIALLARWRPRPPRQADVLPSVSLIVPAYNEARCIAAKLDNALSLDYPADRLEVWVVADGSTDGTPDIVRGYAGRNVRLLYEPPRRGKIAAMNRTVLQTCGDILVFSDANTLMEPGSLRVLVRNFADPAVACVGGEKRVRSGGDVQARGESAYWRYEARLKAADSLVNTAIGAVGEFFAIRRALYQPLEEDCLLDDFVLSMRLVMVGWRVVYEPRAITYEDASPSLRSEWNRRARNAAGGFQALGRLRGLLSPRHGFVAFQFLSHKVGRWTAPFWMIVAFLASAALYSVPLYRLLFWAQAAFYAAALLGWLSVAAGRRWRLLQIVFYFCFANATALGGFFRYLFREQTVLWNKVR
jgi:biofilm PGA synthesis N-glycosyltransferase PgaC